VKCRPARRAGLLGRGSRPAPVRGSRFWRSVSGSARLLPEAGLLSPRCCPPSPGMAVPRRIDGPAAEGCRYSSRRMPPTSRRGRAAAGPGAKNSACAGCLCS